MFKNSDFRCECGTLATRTKEESRSRRLSRRDFARASVAAGAAVVALPRTLLGKELPAGTSAAARGAAVARRRVTSLPPEVAYGGISMGGADEALASAPQTTSYPGGWQEGTTIPSEYYLDEKHYLNDERFITEHFWLMVDHESRIPSPGDYFLFQFGLGDSVIILRDQAGAVQAYHNVCRHRGSRLCIHDELLPSEARADGKPEDPVLSVVQQGATGNTPVFRCPYHAWTYDLSGKLVHYPPGMPNEFNPAEHGLHPAHLQLVEGFIYVNFAREEPPEFDPFVATWQAVAEQYGTAQLKVIARRSLPTKANWKLVLENFRECYHCLPSHSRSYRAVHGVFSGENPSGTRITTEQRARIEAELAEHGHPVQRRQRTGTPPRPVRRDLLGQVGDGYPVPTGMGMGSGGSHLKIGFVTGSLDGKPVAPLLPARSEWTHTTQQVTTGFSTAYIQAYDDHVAVVRFTPRAVDLTDAEIFYLVHPDATENDVDIDRMVALWANTYREDRWIAENNHHGLRSSRYAFRGGQPYAASETGPRGLAKWYMRDVVPQLSE